MPVFGTGIPAAYVAPSNTTLTNQIGVVTYTPILSGCVGVPAIDTINIKPTPLVAPVPNYFYCPNQTTSPINFVFLPSGGNPVFTWTGLGGVGGTQTGDVPSFITVNTSLVTIVSTITYSYCYIKWMSGTG